MSWLKLIPTVLRWVGAAFMTYEVAGIVEEVGDKFPDAIDADVVIDAGGTPVAPGPYRTTRRSLVAAVLVAAAISWGMSRVAKRLK